MVSHVALLAPSRIVSKRGSGSQGNLYSRMSCDLVDRWRIDEPTVVHEDKKERRFEELALMPMAGGS